MVAGLRSMAAAMGAGRISAALATVAAEVQRSKLHDLAAAKSLVSVLDELAATVRKEAAATADALRETLARDRRSLAVSPLDPSAIDWSPFAYFEAQEQETRWTQWLSGLLNPANGSRVAEAAWMGLCAAIAEACVTTPPRTGHASAEEWRLAGSDRPLSVTHEEAFADGRLDLVIRTPHLVAVIENKLWADWHDSPKRLQSDAYAAQGEVIRKATGVTRLGLVLLTCRKEMDPRGEWVLLTYARLARHLRSAAQAISSGGDRDAVAVVTTLPLLLTIQAIERYLLGVGDTPVGPATAFHEVQRLQHVLQALEVETP